MPEEFGPDTPKWEKTAIPAEHVFIKWLAGCKTTTKKMNAK